MYKMSKTIEQMIWILIGLHNVEIISSQITEICDNRAYFKVVFLITKNRLLYHRISQK